MPIQPIRLQRSLREVGRIRCGDQTHSGKGRAPRRLTCFRFTSDDAGLLELVADRYGGSVEPWANAPSGEQWQVYSTSDRIPVMMAPQLQPISQWMEAWSGGGCQRRCDGVTEMISGQPCLCTGLNDDQCRPTTRLSLILPDVPGLGVWRLESKGYWAAVELGGITDLISRLVQATGEVVHGTLRLQQRTQKRTGQPTRHFAVPTLDVAASIPELAERMAGHPQRPSQAVDGAAGGLVPALATRPAQGTTAGPRGLPSPEASQLAEDRAAERLAGKRTPPMGPGSRGKRLPREADTGTTDSPEDQEIREAFGSPLSSRQLTALQTLMRSTGLSDRDERLLFASRIIGRSISSSKDLTSEEASRVIDVLAAVESGAAEYVTDEGGRIIGAVPAAVLAEALHEAPLSDDQAPGDEVAYGDSSPNTGDLDEH